MPQSEGGSSASTGLSSIVGRCESILADRRSQSCVQTTHRTYDCEISWTRLRRSSGESPSVQKRQRFPVSTPRCEGRTSCRGLTLDLQPDRLWLHPSSLARCSASWGRHDAGAEHPAREDTPRLAAAALCRSLALSPDSDSVSNRWLVLEVSRPATTCTLLTTSCASTSRVEQVAGPCQRHALL